MAIIDRPKIDFGGDSHFFRGEQHKPLKRRGLKARHDAFFAPIDAKLDAYLTQHPKAKVAAWTAVALTSAGLGYIAVNYLTNIPTVLSR